MTGYRKTKRLAGQTDVWQQLDEIAAEQRATEREEESPAS